MNYLFSITIFLFISFSVFAQKKNPLIGTYTYVQKKGVHTLPGGQIRDYHFTPYTSHIDTSIRHSLTLNANHSSVLQIDTLVHLFTGLRPQTYWFGKWKKTNDTLFVQFTDSITQFQFYLVEPKSQPTVLKMKSKIIFEFLINTNDNQVYSLDSLNSNSPVTYTKE